MEQTQIDVYHERYGSYEKVYSYKSFICPREGQTMEIPHVTTICIERIKHIVQYSELQKIEVYGTRV